MFFDLQRDTVLLSLQKKEKNNGINWYLNTRLFNIYKFIQTEEYLTTRKELKKVCVLIDSRHGLKQLDIQMLSLLNTAQVPFNIILTKVNKIILF